VVFEIEPAELGSGITFEIDIVGGVIPKAYYKAIQRGVNEAAEAGVVAGYPVTDVNVPCMTVLSTRWIQMNWLSKLRVQWHLEKASSEVLQYC
jgi:translation elongation factor EF-G